MVRQDQATQAMWIEREQAEKQQRRQSCAGGEVDREQPQQRARTIGLCDAAMGLDPRRFRIRGRGPGRGPHIHITLIERNGSPVQIGNGGGGRGLASALLRHVPMSAQRFD